jgi:hypothetical protein
VLDEELDLYLACMQFVHGIVLNLESHVRQSGAKTNLISINKNSVESTGLIYQTIAQDYTVVSENFNAGMN